MKKMTFIACAAMLTSAVVLSSCNKNEQNAPDQPAKDVVKTEFAIALPGQLSNGAHRMPSTTVQRDGSSQFQGITSILLVPFAKQGEIEISDTRLGENIALTGDVEAADIAKPSKAKVYSNVSIPLSTASFLFYAKSGASGTKYEKGSLVADTADHDTPADIKFTLEQIQASPTFMTASGIGGKLMEYLSHVAIASDGAKAWYQYTSGDNAALKAMFDTYSSMKGLSSFEVARVLTDLYQSLTPLVASNDLASAICDSISSTYFTFASVNGSGVVSLSGDYNTFPSAFGLPDGSINIKWDGTSHKFIEGDYENMARPNNYVYPAELWYYVNSQIKTSNSSKQTMYDNVNNWSAILAAHTDAISVNSLTRAVAIQSPVQYAVARFDTQVRLKANTLADNSETVEGIATAVDCSAGFPISAILVGGQQEVKFDFTANTSATEYTIYDSVMTSRREAEPATMLAVYSTTTFSAPNHTLVLENGTSDVMVAIEMTNTTGVDFYGAGGQLIPKGGKFYVVAKLLAEAATQTSGHVFKQDFTTTAKLTLKDLKSAYNTIPDLRTPQLEIGFSVDLTWQEGHTYDFDF